MAERWQNPTVRNRESSWYWLVELPDGCALLTEHDLERGRKRWVREGRPQPAKSKERALQKKVAELESRLYSFQKALEDRDQQIARLKRPWWKKLWDLIREPF